MSFYIPPKIKAKLAQCRCCAEPMVYIYSSELRDYCYSCDKEFQEFYEEEIGNVGR